MSDQTLRDKAFKKYVDEYGEQLSSSEQYKIKCDFEAGYIAAMEQMKPAVEALEKIRDTQNTDWPDRIHAVIDTARKALEQIQAAKGK